MQEYRRAVEALEDKDVFKMFEEERERERKLDRGIMATMSSGVFKDNRKERRRKNKLQRNARRKQRA